MLSPGSYSPPWTPWWNSTPVPWSPQQSPGVCTRQPCSLKTVSLTFFSYTRAPASADDPPLSLRPPALFTLNPKSLEQEPLHFSRQRSSVSWPLWHKTLPDAYSLTSRKLLKAFSLSQYFSLPEEAWLWLLRQQLPPLQDPPRIFPSGEPGLGRNFKETKAEHQENLSIFFFKFIVSN